MTNQELSPVKNDDFGSILDPISDHFDPPLEIVSEGPKIGPIFDLEDPKSSPRVDFGRFWGHFGPLFGPLFGPPRETPKKGHRTRQCSFDPLFRAGGSRPPKWGYGFSGVSKICPIWVPRTHFGTILGPFWTQNRPRGPFWLLRTQNRTLLSLS